MTGEAVKQILYLKGIKITEPAERLEISQQNMSSQLTVKDIKTGTLERIAEASGVPLSEFYGIAPLNITNVSGNNQLNKINKQPIYGLQRHNTSVVGKNS